MEAEIQDVGTQMATRFLCAKAGGRLTTEELRIPQTRIPSKLSGHQRAMASLGDVRKRRKGTRRKLDTRAETEKYTLVAVVGEKRQASASGRCDTGSPHK